jgi:organic radical activating enzyme
MIKFFSTEEILRNQRNYAPLKIQNLDILLTFKCPAECKHCSYKAGPENTGSMELEDVGRYLTTLKNTHPLHSITVHGGEPFLYFKHLKHIVKTSKDLEIARRGVITNSYWAKTKGIAGKKLQELKKAGLTQITFSADVFHQEFIPLENVKNAIISATNIDFDNIWIDTYFVGDINADNLYNNKNREILKKLEEMGINKIDKYVAGFEGRGADLAKFGEVKEGIPSGKCPLPFWIGGDLKAPTTVEIDWEGNVTLCPGICIGNTRIHPLVDILQNYDCSTHPILSKILDEGPKGLLKLAAAKGFKQDISFVNECHLCYELRKFLRPFYPQFLAPSSCY